MTHAKVTHGTEWAIASLRHGPTALAHTHMRTRARSIAMCQNGISHDNPTVPPSPWPHCPRTLNLPRPWMMSGTAHSFLFRVNLLAAVSLRAPIRLRCERCVLQGVDFTVSDITQARAMTLEMFANCHWQGDQTFGEKRSTKFKFQEYHAVCHAVLFHAAVCCAVHSKLVAELQ